MQPKLIFLDIHGVLGPLAGPREIEPRCVEYFNTIPDETGAKIVLTSSLRELIHQGHMDLLGFGALLRTHGVHGQLLGVIDTNQDEIARWRLIVRWLTNYQHGKFVILDDNPEACPPGTVRGGFFIHTFDNLGLTAGDAAAAIRWLKE